MGLGKMKKIAFLLFTVILISCSVLYYIIFGNKSLEPITNFYKKVAPPKVPKKSLPLPRGEYGLKLGMTPDEFIALGYKINKSKCTLLSLINKKYIDNPNYYCEILVEDTNVEKIFVNFREKDNKIKFITIYYTKEFATHENFELIANEIKKINNNYKSKVEDEQYSYRWEDNKTIILLSYIPWSIIDRLTIIYSSYGK